MLIGSKFLKNTKTSICSPVLDQTEWSGPNNSETGLYSLVSLFPQSSPVPKKKDPTRQSSLELLGPDCRPKVPDRTVRSFGMVSKKGHGPDRTGPWPV